MDECPNVKHPTDVADQIAYGTLIAIAGSVGVIAVLVLLSCAMALSKGLRRRAQNRRENSRDIELVERGLRTAPPSAPSAGQAGRQPPRENLLPPSIPDFSLDLDDVDLGSPAVTPRAAPIQRKPLPNPPSMSSLSTARQPQMDSRPGSLGQAPPVPESRSSTETALRSQTSGFTLDDIYDIYGASPVQEAKIKSRPVSPAQAPSIPETRSLTEKELPHKASVSSMSDEGEGDIYGASEVSSIASATDRNSAKEKPTAGQDTSSEGPSAPLAELPAPMTDLPGHALSPIPEARETSPDPKQ